MDYPPIECDRCGNVMRLREHIDHTPQFIDILAIDGGRFPIRIQDTYDITVKAFCGACGNTIEDVDVWVKRQYNQLINN
jgi:hypothetical protein